MDAKLEKFITARRQYLIYENEQISLSVLNRIWNKHDYYVDCYSCEHYNTRTGYCSLTKVQVPSELLDLGCGKGTADIPF